MSHPFRTVCLCSLLVLSAVQARAATLDYNTVAVADKLIGGYNIGSSDAAESQFLTQYLIGKGYDASTLTYEKINVSGVNSFVQVVNDPVGTNLYAIDFSAFGVSDPLVFLVKYGNAVYQEYLYENLASLEYGVVDLNAIKAANGNITITSISHTGTVGTPEPATLALLGVGAAVATLRRRRRANQS